MAVQRAGIDAGMQSRWREMEEQVCWALSGPGGCPEWGTKFRELEQQGMSVGLELARLVMERSVATQAERVPGAALVVEGDVVPSAGRETTLLEQTTPLTPSFDGEWRAGPQ